ncbi:MAG: hypothetical protein RQ729_01460 [Wenzhouxiangellaceae bacterium]|nr:hypothetical protein [Wenzhouxiangellaceae bacterium]
MTRTLRWRLPARAVIALAGCLLASLALAQGGTGFSSLEERMTGREFTESGLHKLSPEELATLNRWIRLRSLAENEVPTDALSDAGGPAAAGVLPDRPGELPPVDKMAREPFQTRVVGRFNGSDGKARFKLENGMVWEQTDGKAFYVAEVENPMVTIKPGLLGSWRLTVEGYNGAVRVKRIR